MRTDRYLIQWRQHEINLAAELQWQQLPPLESSTPAATVAGFVQPAYVWEQTKPELEYRFVNAWTPPAEPVEATLLLDSTTEVRVRVDGRRMTPAA